MFQFDVELNDNDYYEFNKYHILNSQTGKDTLKGFRFLVPTICAVIIIILCIAQSDFMLIIIEVIVLTILSVISFFFSDSFAKPLLLRSIKKEIMNLKKTGKLPYSPKASLTFDDNSITEITPEMETKVNYLVVERIVTVETAVYVYFSSAQAFIIPLTAFADKENRIQFMAFIQSKIEHK